MKEQLLACPFCGREAEQDFQQAYRSMQTGRIDHGAAVYCIGCNANMIMCRGDHPGLSDEERMAVVVGDWNRRTPPPQTHVEVPDAGLKPIPIEAAKRIAKEYGYDQVLIYARRCHDTPEPHGEHMTTYGRNREHCDVAARIGNTLKKFMGWEV